MANRFKEWNSVYKPAPPEGLYLTGYRMGETALSASA